MSTEVGRDTVGPNDAGLIAMKRPQDKNVRGVTTIGVGLIRQSQG